jgi:chemotaxis protein methyltransferase CheR
MDITPREFKLFQTLIYEETGIALKDHKASMVQARLSKRLRELNLERFSEYYDYLKNEQGSEEMLKLLSAISTNVTSFFREAAQWDFLEEYLKNLESDHHEKRLRIWSAASSTGQEPYSIAMFLHEHLKNFTSWDIKILATDIDTKVLAHAIKGEYAEKDVSGMPKVMLTRYFDKIKEKSGTRYQIKEYLRNMVLYRSFNLTRGDFSIFKNQFDIIFCRNVMIYFDTPTRNELVGRFHKLLKPEGLLLLGHSESLTHSNDGFKLVKSAIYQKT